MTAAALLLVVAAMTAALAENDADKKEPAAATPATPEVTILNKHEVEGVLGRRGAQCHQREYGQDRGRARRPQR